jgi:hypothetical protein
MDSATPLAPATALPTVVTCPGCGDEVRDGEDRAIVGDHVFHVDCVAPHHHEPQPHHLWWTPPV